jgi:hypothetical protein
MVLIPKRNIITTCHSGRSDVCFWHKADISCHTAMSVFGGKADMGSVISFDRE